MKPFLGIDITTNKKNEESHGKEFLTATPSAALSTFLETNSENAEKAIKKSALPLPIRIIKYACAFFALVSVLGIVRSDVSISEAYANAPWIFWAAGICAAVWGVLWLIEKQRSKAMLEDDDTVRTMRNIEDVSEAIYRELAVPENTAEVDVLAFFYKEKNGEVKLKSRGMQFCDYMNPVFNAYSDAENLYLVNLEGKYAFPLADIKAIRTVKKHISIMGWNKDASITSPTYKQYKLTVDKFDCIHCKYYHIIEVNRGGEAFGIYIPCYELPVFEKLTSLKAQDE